MFAWKFAFKNIFRNQRRSLSTGIAIAAGYVGLVLLGAYLIRTQRGLEASTVYLNFKGHISIYKKDSIEHFAVRPQKYQIDSETLAKLENIISENSQDIEFTGKFLTGTGLISNGNKSVPFMATGFEPLVYERILNHPILHRWAHDWVVASGSADGTEFIKNPETISITAAMGELLGIYPPLEKIPEDKRSLQLAARNYQRDLNAVNASVGPFHTTGITLAEDTSLSVPLRLLQDLYSTDGVRYVAIFLKESASVSKNLKRFQAVLEKSGLELEVFPFNDDRVSSFYVGTMGFLRIMAGFFVFLICGAVILSVVNSMTMGLIERTKEVGTLRAIGYQDSFVCGLFVREALCLTVLSVICGFFIAQGIASVVNGLNLRFSPPGTAGDIQFLLAADTDLCVGSAVFLILISGFTAYFVVSRKTKNKIVDLLSDAGA